MYFRVLNEKSRSDFLKKGKLRRIFDLRGRRKGWRQLHSATIHKFQLLPNVTKAIKTRMRRAEHVARKREREFRNKIFWLENLKRKKQFGRSGRSRDDTKTVSKKKSPVDSTGLP